MTTITASWREFHLGRWLLLLLILFLLAIPLPNLLLPESKLVTNSLLFSFTQLFMLITLASDWNLTGGFTGYIDFGHAVFFGLGAYGTGIMMNKLGVPFGPALLVGAVAAVIFALLIGFPTLRLKGPYFSIAMLATFVAMREIVRVVRPLTGGGQGLTLPPYLNRPLFYYATLGLAIFVVSLIWWIRRSEFGASLIAIREDEVGAEMRGINTTLAKITAFCIAAFFTGIVGGLWAYQNTFIDPDVVFFPSRTVELVMMVMLGGLGTVAGPVVGATVIYWLRDIVWANFEQYHLIVEGLLLILIVLYLPGGIVGTYLDRGGTSLLRVWGKKPSEPEAEEEVAT
ncbi:MAG: branched-chain amino acid ABC transporter permease [Chloroflexota bacterium]|nr:MAG: branched-chain amino acid ABC transporter permease [Chloroflexota bacterium]